MSFAAMIPMAGSAATVTKWGKKLVDKADEVATAGKWVKCKVTGKGCFVSGTKGWVASSASDSESWFDGYEAVGSAVARAGTITKVSIESVAIGSRLAGDNPQPWECDDLRELHYRHFFGVDWILTPLQQFDYCHRLHLILGIEGGSGFCKSPYPLDFCRSCFDANAAG